LGRLVFGVAALARLVFGATALARLVFGATASAKLVFGATALVKLVLVPRHPVLVWHWRGWFLIAVALHGWVAGFYHGMVLVVVEST